VNTHTRARGRGFARALAATSLSAVAIAAAAPAAASAPTTPDTVTVNAQRHVLAGTRVRTAGALASKRSGQTVLLQLSQGRGWKTIDRVKTRAGGRYAAFFTPKSVRRYGVRVRTLDGSATRVLEGGVTAYRRSAASWYGPGFYGRRTACGRTLGRGTLGVAHKSLPCGTRVQFRYRGRTVTAPVIDRGPYAAGREYDLTAATKQRLRFGSTGTVWSSPRS
jgi:rare lipoprotein A (peptidoglycan hydrolase)